MAQIWKSLPINLMSFEDKIKTIYELSYKYQMIQSNPFNGLPDRKDNILVNIEKNLRPIISDIVATLHNVFEGWLERHAIVDPKKWAMQRTMKDFQYAQDNKNNLKEDIIETGEILSESFFEYGERSNVNGKNILMYRTINDKNFMDVEIDKIVDGISNKIQSNPQSSIFTKALTAFSHPNSKRKKKKKCYF